MLTAYHTVSELHPSYGSYSYTYVNMFEGATKRYNMFDLFMYLEGLHLPDGPKTNRLIRELETLIQVDLWACTFRS